MMPEMGAETIIHKLLGNTVGRTSTGTCPPRDTGPFPLPPMWPLLIPHLDELRFAHAPCCPGQCRSRAGQAHGMEMPPSVCPPGRGMWAIADVWGRGRESALGRFTTSLL